MWHICGSQCINLFSTAYHCAYVSDILLQGFLYVTHNWFCFYSKLLGKKRVSTLAWPGSEVVFLLNNRVKRPIQCFLIIKSLPDSDLLYAGFYKIAIPLHFCCNLITAVSRP